MKKMVTCGNCYGEREVRACVITGVETTAEAISFYGILLL
jgi:hypothetical protein